MKLYVPTHTMRPNTILAFTNKSMQVQFGMVKAQPQVHLSVSPRISTFRKLQLECRWRRSNVTVDTGLTQTLSKGSSLGIGVRHDSRQGVSWIFSWIRGEVVIKIPIFLFPSAHMGMMQYFYSCGLGLTSYLIQECISDVWQLKNASPSPSGDRTAAAAFFRSKARKDAEMQKSLMAKQAAARRNAEEMKQGLIIVKATYFCIGGDQWDVTTQLQFWTAKSSLDLPALSKQNLLGFYNVAGTDPIVKEPEWWQLWTTAPVPPVSKPKLSVRYQYGGETFEIVIDDEEALSLPSSKARRVLIATEK